MAEFISTVSLSYPLPSGQNCLYPGDTRLITAAVLVKDEFGNVVPTPSIDTSVHWALKYGSGSLSAASSNSVVYTAASIDPSAYDAIAVVEARSNYRNQTAVSVSGFIATFVSGAPFSQDYAGTWVMIGAGYFLVQSVGSGGGQPDSRQYGRVASPRGPDRYRCEWSVGECAIDLREPRHRHKHPSRNVSRYVRMDIFLQPVWSVWQCSLVTRSGLCGEHQLFVGSISFTIKQNERRLWGHDTGHVRRLFCDDEYPDLLIERAS